MKKFRYYNPSLGYRWCSFRIDVTIVTASFVDDVIIHCLLCFDPKCIGQVLKSSDIIIPISVIDGALSESDVLLVTSSFIDDVIIGEV